MVSFQELNALKDTQEDFAMNVFWMIQFNIQGLANINVQNALLLIAMLPKWEA
jgi:hypothetical protein